MCLNYEGNKKVREAKANLLVQQCELFKMKENENIKTMFSRFKTLVPGLHILKKSYSTVDQLNKILRRLPTTWRHKVTAIYEVRDLNTLSI